MTGRHGSGQPRSRCFRWSDLPDYSQGATHYVAPKRLRQMPVWTTAMAVSHRIDGHVFFSDRNPIAKVIPARGLRRNAPSITAVALNEPDGAVVIDPVFVSDTRAQVQQGGTRQTCGSLHLLPTVNVEAALLSDRQMPVRSSHRRRATGTRRPIPGPTQREWLIERRIRTGARRLTAA